MKPLPLKNVYKVSQVAKMFLVTPMHIYRLIYQGKLKAYKGNGMVRIAEDDIREFQRKYSTRPLKSLHKIICNIERKRRR